MVDTYDLNTTSDATYFKSGNPLTVLSDARCFKPDNTDTILSDGRFNKFGNILTILSNGRFKLNVTRTSLAAESVVLGAYTNQNVHIIDRTPVIHEVRREDLNRNRIVGR